MLALALPLPHSFCLLAMPILYINESDSTNLDCDIDQVYSSVRKLMVSSLLHSNLPLHYIEKSVYPLIKLDQFLLVFEGGNPVGYCSWAFLSKLNSAKYISAPYSLDSESWISGDNLWIIDFMVDGNYLTCNRLADLIADIHGHKQFAFALRVKHGSSCSRVMVLRGKGANKTWKLSAEYLIRDFFILSALLQRQL